MEVFTAFLICKLFEEIAHSIHILDSETVVGTQKKTILHNGVGIFKITQIFTERWMSCNVTRKSNPCLNVIFFQKSLSTRGDADTGME
jgi:hypothetical protein